MSESKEITAKSLYLILLREAENESVMEVAPELYTSISEYVGKLKNQGYEGAEAKVQDGLISIMSEMTSILLRTRLEKSIKSDSVNYTNLLDEEKFILDAYDDMKERKEMILSGTLSGKSKLLESIAKKHKTKSTVVRFLQEMDQIVGADLEKYGPFKAEDVATIPFENAQALLAKKIVTKIHWED